MIICFILLQADIKPKVDGCNGLRYDLTVDIIDSIFRTYPAGTINNSVVKLVGFYVQFLSTVCADVVWFVCSCCVREFIIFKKDTYITVSCEFAVADL